MPERALDDLRAALAEVSDLGHAGALMAWDEKTHMPPTGAAARAEQLATLARVRHERFTSDRVGRLLDAAAAEVEGAEYDSVEASLVRIARRKWEKARRVPGDLLAEMTQAASVGENAWVEARRRSDFAAFLPHLERNVELRRRYGECFDGFEHFSHPYDPQLDDFEPGVSTEAIRAVLADLRDGVKPLIAEIAPRADELDASCLFGAFPVDAQERFARVVAEGLPLRENGWRLDGTVHPFATAMAPTDVRITTRFDEGYVGTALWSVVHEAGHAMYDSGFADELWRTPLANAPSLGFHESQSRLWENWVGRGLPYLTWLRPRLAEAFPGTPIAEVDADALYRAANRVEPSLIRVEADPVTYDLHIVLRFELELEILEGTIRLEELPEAWNARMAEYLGVEVPDDANGVLQDVHWSSGSFGYFPTYSIGNMLAAQIWKRARADIRDLDSQLAAGELRPLHAWLSEHIYRHGAKLMPTEMVERVTGAPLSAGPYVEQLRERVSALYGL
jgi:carboxypeptidase Taq